MNTPKKKRLGRKKRLHLDAGYATVLWSEWFRLLLSLALSGVFNVLRPQYARALHRPWPPR